MSTYELSVEREFCAAHAIRIGDHLEPVHGHNWKVHAIVGGHELDHNGLLCDFHLIEKLLDGIVASFHNRHLNDVAPFDQTNPTAEQVARHIGEALRRQLPDSVRLSSLTVSEAPGCRATWRPTADDRGS